MVNEAILQTIPRTINTGLGAMFILAALALLGGDSLTDFAIALLLGTVLRDLLDDLHGVAAGDLGGGALAARGQVAPQGRRPVLERPRRRPRIRTCLSFSRPRSATSASTSSSCSRGGNIRVIQLL